MPSQTENDARSAATLTAQSLTGRSLIGFREGKASAEPFFAINPLTGQQIEPAFISATADDVDEAVRLAAESFHVYRLTSGRVRGALLRKIAEKIESIESDIVERAALETALPAARLKSETART